MEMYVNDSVHKNMIHSKRERTQKGGMSSSSMNVSRVSILSFLSFLPFHNMILSPFHFHSLKHNLCLYLEKQSIIKQTSRAAINKQLYSRFIIFDVSLSIPFIPILWTIIFFTFLLWPLSPGYLTTDFIAVCCNLSALCHATWYVSTIRIPLPLFPFCFKVVFIVDARNILEIFLIFTISYLETCTCYLIVNRETPRSVKGQTQREVGKVKGWTGQLLNHSF